MKLGIGVDASVGLSFDEEAALISSAKALGYESAWTPSGSASHDGFQTCAAWARATGGPAEDGFELGVAVMPAPLWTVPSLASQSGTVAAMSGGRFILGLGTGGIYTEGFRRSYGLPDWPTVGMMRDYTTALRGLFAGGPVSYAGKAVTLDSVTMFARPANVPVYLAALGPQMLRLAGELADGVCLNWTAPDERPQCRERIAEGARRAGRDPGTVTVMEYIRVCVDEDEERARRAFTRAFLGYALAHPGASKAHGYRGHFARQGFDDALISLENARDAGASTDELVEATPTEMLRQVGYYGRPEGAASALRELSRNLDVAVVRIVSSAPGPAAAMATVEACQPALLRD